MDRSDGYVCGAVTVLVLLDDDLLYTNYLNDNNNQTFADIVNHLDGC